MSFEDFLFESISYEERIELLKQATVAYCSRKDVTPQTALEFMKGLYLEMQSYIEQSDYYKRDRL